MSYETDIIKNREIKLVQAMIELQSLQSMRVSLETIKRGEGGLDERRESMLKRVPDVGTWARFPHEHLLMKDLAYLTAKTGHEFAILRGKHEDILFHGSATSCTFNDVLVDWLLSKRFVIYGHSHPGDIVPSKGDRNALKRIGQKSSRLISGMNGMEVVFTDNPFEIV